MENNNNTVDSINIKRRKIFKGRCIANCVIFVDLLARVGYFVWRFDL